MKINHWAEDVFEMKSAKRKGLPRCDYCGGDREIALLSTIGAQRLCESCATLSLEERKEVKKFQAQKEAVDHGLDDQVMAVKRRLGLKTDSEAEELIEKKKDQKRLVPCPDPKMDHEPKKAAADWFIEWRHSINMPRWASRITLEAKDISVERLQNIYASQQDISPVNHWDECPYSKYDGSLWEYCGEGFRVHWDGHQWNARCTNPCAIYISIFDDVDPFAMEIEGFWNLIEYGGCISTHEKPKSLKRNPNKAPDIKVPWDPYTV
jgi:hypothetical protein